MTYTFDNNGNLPLQNRGGVQTQYVYDRSNRFKVEVAGDASLTTMLYDGDGLRRVKQVKVGKLPTVVTTFVWDGSDYLAEYR